jgi:hypothetical protein
MEIASDILRVALALGINVAPHDFALGTHHELFAEGFERDRPR